jgi:hypothetical protein
MADCNGTVSPQFCLDEHQTLSVKRFLPLRLGYTPVSVFEYE